MVLLVGVTSKTASAVIAGSILAHGATTATLARAYARREKRPQR